MRIREALYDDHRIGCKQLHKFSWIIFWIVQFYVALKYPFVIKTNFAITTTTGNQKELKVINPPLVTAAFFVMLVFQLQTTKETISAAKHTELIPLSALGVPCKSWYALSYSSFVAIRVAMVIGHAM